MPDRPLTAPELAATFEAIDNAELARQERALKTEPVAELPPTQVAIAAMRAQRVALGYPATGNEWLLLAAYDQLEAERDELRIKLAAAEKHARELDRALGETIDDRDRTEEAADKLAYAVAPIEVIGEHSSMNCPWENALDLITPMAEVDKLRDENRDYEKALGLNEEAA